MAVANTAASTIAIIADTSLPLGDPMEPFLTFSALLTDKVALTAANAVKPSVWEYAKFMCGSFGFSAVCRTISTVCCSIC